MNLKERVKLLCKENKTSMNQLEQELGLSRGYLSKIHQSTPSADKLAKIADFFGVSVEYLINGEEPLLKEEVIAGRELKDMFLDIANLLRSHDVSPLYYDGEPADDKDIELVLQQVQLSMALFEKNKE